MAMVQQKGINLIRFNLFIHKCSICTLIVEIDSIAVVIKFTGNSDSRRTRYIRDPRRKEQ